MQPEVAMNLRVFFENQRREKPLIINYFHWIDCHESAKFAKELSGYIWRQVEGARVADINLFHTEAARKMFLDYSVANELPIGTLTTSYFRPKPTKFGLDKMVLGDKKIILFNHRLNNSTGWQEILKVCKDIWQTRKDFTLWFTDDQNLKETDKIEENEFVICRSVPFGNYGYFLSKCHFSVCNIKGYATWNMAVLDSINFGTPVLAVEKPLWKELGCYTTSDMKGEIIKMLDSAKMEPRDVILKNFNIVEFVEDQIKARVSEKDPLKYDDVVEMISTAEDTVEKKEWVNKFWSFHANSNFQIIRWKMLAEEGIKDDTSKEYTTYYV